MLGKPQSSGGLPVRCYEQGLSLSPFWVKARSHCRPWPCNIEPAGQQGIGVSGSPRRSRWVGRPSTKATDCTALLPRAHRNDMETIYPFLFLGFIYSFLGPTPLIAWIHFLVVLTGRVVHTVAYLGKLNPRIRSGAYVLAQFACVSMALQILWEAAHHL